MSISGAIQSWFNGGAQLAKLEIRYETLTVGQFTGSCKAMFNPSDLRYAKQVTWQIAPVTGQSALAGFHQVSFCATNPKTLSINLFFDTYEGPQAQGTASAVTQAVAAFRPTNPFARVPSGTNVRTETQKITSLAAVQKELHQPPVCQLWWGSQMLLQGVLTSVNEDYTMFLADGTPVRAILTCVFTEAIDASSSNQLTELNSPDVVKHRVVKRGDTLSGIAAEMYNDPSEWRRIADANGIVDPRHLEAFIGKTLTIPKIVG